MKYAFFDINVKNESDGREYDIVGEDYKDLIDVCCKYSKYFSLVYLSNSEEVKNLLSPYIATVDPARFEMYSEYLSPLRSKKTFYHVCPQTRAILCEHVDTLWSWISDRVFNNPEDLTFYREDSSIFLKTVIHDGECALNVYDNENVSEIIVHENWTKVSELPQYFRNHWIMDV